MAKEKKKTLTYYGDPLIRRKAIRVAKKNKTSFGKLVDQLLESFMLQPKDMGVYGNFIEETKKYG